MKKICLVLSILVMVGMLTLVMGANPGFSWEPRPTCCPGLSLEAGVHLDYHHGDNQNGGSAILDGVSRYEGKGCNLEGMVEAWGQVMGEVKHIDPNTVSSYSRVDASFTAAGKGKDYTLSIDAFGAQENYAGKAIDGAFAQGYNVSGFEFHVNKEAPPCGNWEKISAQGSAIGYTVAHASETPESRFASLEMKFSSTGQIEGEGTERYFGEGYGAVGTYKAGYGCETMGLGQAWLSWDGPVPTEGSINLNSESTIRPTEGGGYMAYTKVYGKVSKQPMP